MYLHDLGNKLTEIEIGIIKKIRDTKWGEVNVKVKGGNVVMVSKTEDIKIDK